MDDVSEQLHARMSEWFGVPTPTEREHEEVFGWYHSDGDTRYWVFNPKEERFRVITGVHRSKDLAGEWQEGDAETLAHAMDALSMLPHLPLPDDTTRPARSEPFAFEGWLFAWFFFPELRRWELGVIERRWRTEPRYDESGQPFKDPRAKPDGPYDKWLDIATKTISAGAQLYDQYRRQMLLVGAWTPPAPETGLRLIAGAAGAAAEHYNDRADIVRLVARATGCEEQQVVDVIEFVDRSELLSHRWYRPSPFHVGFNMS